MSDPVVPLDPDRGAAQRRHHWLAPGEAPNTSKWTCCRDCGAVKQADGTESACRGVVKVELRSGAARGPEVPLDPDRLARIEAERMVYHPHEALALVAAAREAIALREALDEVTASANAAEDHNRRLRAEVARLRDVVRASDPQVMHPHMGGDHQVHYRGSGKNLTPEQWHTIALATDRGPDA